MAVVMLRDVCGVRSGDKGDISDLSLFADDRETYDALVEQVTPERVKEHFAEFVTGPVERHLVPNLLALKVRDARCPRRRHAQPSQRHHGQDVRSVAPAPRGRPARPSRGAVRARVRPPVDDGRTQGSSPRDAAS